MQVHGSCVARNGLGVLLLGASGSGKSDLALRLIDRGFMLVADDRVDIVEGFARAPAGLAGLLEVRGVGIVRMAFEARARLGLAVRLGAAGVRLPEPEEEAGVPLIRLDAREAAAAARVALALEIVAGRVGQQVGAFVRG